VLKNLIFVMAGTAADVYSTASETAEHGNEMMLSTK
jgi:hypothetical protein